MQEITADGHRFALAISEQEIQAKVKELASQISKDYEGANPLFLVVLNGTMFFATDLLRGIDYPVEMCSTKLSSYQGTESTGQVKEILPIPSDVKGRKVVVIEDIVETGCTINYLYRRLTEMEAAHIDVCTLLVKRQRMDTQIPLRYVGFEIADEYIIGYGLDLNNSCRNLRHIYQKV